MKDIELRDLSKFYEEGGKRVNILDHINAGFREGELVSVLGKSGSGKTTLLNLISGIDSPDSGGVLISGASITKLSEKERTVFRRKHMGLVFQFFNLIPTLTVLENVTLPSELDGCGRDKSGIKARELLGKVGLVDRSDTYPDRLSGGEQQRVAIARALINDPDIILADEPTGNLDEDTAAEVLALLLRLVREAGVTMVIATHSAEIKNYSDAVYTIHNGALINLQNEESSLALNP